MVRVTFLELPKSSKVLIEILFNPGERVISLEKVPNREESTSKSSVFVEMMIANLGVDLPVIVRVLLKLIILSSGFVTSKLKITGALVTGLDKAQLERGLSLFRK